MTKSRVAVVACRSYNKEEVDAAVRRGIGLLGGVEGLFGKDERILLKPNFLVGKAPEAAVTTHPALFGAVVDALHEAGCENLSYGDSPGHGSPKAAARATGFEAVAREKGVELAEFDKGETVHFPEGRMAKAFEIAKGAVEADAIISMSKMKTHAMTRLTGAIKNQFGLVVGFNKAAAHSKFPDVTDFARNLIDLNRLKKPRLYIMDGIVAMEGNGPKNGTPVDMNVILLSEDGAALDTVYAYLVDMDPSFVPTNVAAAEAGFGATRMEDIEVVGDDLEALRNPGFKAERIPAKGEAASGALGKLKYLRNFITRRPVLDKEKCLSCGVCERHCPQNPKAITMRGNPPMPKYDYSRCIRCYCCQELCPNDAIKVKTPFWGKVFIYR